MNDRIPDDVIEAMATDGRLCESEANISPATVRSMLAAAEAMGWKLVPREPTIAMSGWGENTIQRQHTRAGIALEELAPNGDPYGYCGSVETWRAMWDTAPCSGAKGNQP